MIMDTWNRLRSVGLSGPEASWFKRIREYAWILFRVFLIEFLGGGLEALCAAPDTVADEFFVKPHRKFLLLKRYEKSGMRVEARILAICRDNMVVEYSTPDEGETIRKAVWGIDLNCDFEVKFKRDKPVTLLLLPGTSTSGYPEAFIEEQLEAKDSMFAALGRLIWGFVVTTFALVCCVFLALLRIYITVAYLGHEPYLVHEVAKQGHQQLSGFQFMIGFLFRLSAGPFTLKLLQIKHDREIFLTSMERNVEMLMKLYSSE
mmetsp:Transcript_21167/g.29448  ORF Transcript_21167/g.29448 Transcript_21167/m.29448 type:complete len:261 (-) Transcript_21167:526-1308(-)